MLCFLKNFSAKILTGTIFFWIFSELFLGFLPTALAEETATPSTISGIKGKVVDISHSKVSPYQGEKNADYTLYNQKAPEFIEENILEIQILSGADNGQIIYLKNQVSDNPYDITPEKGDTLVLNKIITEEGDLSNQYYIQGFWYIDTLIFWAVVLILAILFFGGKNQGVKSLLSLAISLFIIFLLYIPALQSGNSPLGWAIVSSFLISVITLPIIHGLSMKALVSICGTVIGITVASLIAEFILHISQFSGMGTEEMRLFIAGSTQNHIASGILFSGIIIGAMGAIMDVAVSISSGLQEIKEHKPKITKKELFISGMVIGKDIMGSMLNTLIFAYVGASLSAILLVSQLEVPMREFLNHPNVAEEILRALIGSIALVATIPITALIASILQTKK
jgi:uncharacterized membrane protein